MEHLGFILSAYLVSAAVIAGLIAWVMVDGRLQERALDELDRSGAGRRTRER